jgi:hypothetical protein
MRDVEEAWNVWRTTMFVVHYRAVFPFPSHMTMSLSSSSGFVVHKITHSRRLLATLPRSPPAAFVGYQSLYPPFRYTRGPTPPTNPGLASRGRTGNSSGRVLYVPIRESRGRGLHLSHKRATLNVPNSPRRLPTPRPTLSPFPSSTKHRHRALLLAHGITRRPLIRRPMAISRSSSNSR